MASLNKFLRFNSVLLAVVLLLSVVVSACGKRRAYEEMPVMRAELDAIVSDIGIPISGKRDDVAKSAVASVGYYYNGANSVKKISALWAKAAANHGYGLPGVGKSSYRIMCHNTLPHRYVTLIKYGSGEKAELIIRSEAYEVAYPDCAASGS